MSAIDQILEWFTNLIDSGPPPPWIVLPVFILTRPLLALVHELGHAVAALALCPGRVAVAVGRRPPLVVRDLGRMTIAFNPVTPIWRSHAQCAHAPPDSRAKDALIALGGPAASLLTCIVAWIALVRASSGLLHDALWVIALVALASALGNLVPYTFTDQQGRRTQSDGATIIAALR